jgi:hypothetical protein
LRPARIEQGVRFGSKTEIAALRSRCLLCPGERTSSGCLGMPEKCQYQKCDRLDLFDYHVGAGDERRRDHEVERFRGFEIDG